MADTIKVNPMETSIALPSNDQVNLTLRSGPLSVAVQKLYSVCLFDTTTGTVLPTDELDPRHQYKSAEYYFTVPPKSHEMTEPYATNIIPTQNNGKFIESQGVILRDITITGTTGLRPNKLSRDAVPFLKEIPLFGAALSSATDDIAGLVSSTLTPGGLPNSKERTGYDDILFLRNIFRKYSDLKNKEDSFKTLMLWRNAKDADYWVVEPVAFKLLQSASSPMTYDYQISFKTISRFDYKFDVPEDVLSIDDRLNALHQILGESDRVIKNSLFTIANQIDRVESLGIVATNDLFLPAISVLQGINNIANTLDGFGAAFQRNCITLRDNARNELAKFGSSVDTISAAPGIAAVAAQDTARNAIAKLFKVASSLLVSAASVQPKETCLDTEFN